MFLFFLFLNFFFSIFKFFDDSETQKTEKSTYDTRKEEIVFVAEDIGEAHGHLCRLGFNWDVAGP